jgi:hypothetical protein
MANPPYEADQSYAPFRDDTYRAIGRYVIEFSRMFSLMRDKMAYRLARSDDTSKPLETAFGEMTANQLTNAFFSTCLNVGDLDDNEQKVGRWLRARVIKEIERRNDVAHGDWYVTQTVNVQPRRNNSTLRRLKPARSSDDGEERDIPAETLDQWSDEVHELGLLVAGFGQVALGIDAKRRVSDVFVFEKKRVIRRA